MTTPPPRPPYPAYGPPRPPKKPMSTGAIVAITLGSAFGAFILIVLIAAVATTGSSTGGTADAKAEPRTTGAVEEPTAEPTTAAPAKKTTPPSTKAKAPASYPDGDYLIGEDIPPGTYQTSGAQAGLFELCSITTDPTDSSVWSQWKTGNKNERIIITLTKKDHLVSISGCEPLTRR